MIVAIVASLRGSSISSGARVRCHCLELFWAGVPCLGVLIIRIRVPY